MILTSWSARIGIQLICPLIEIYVFALITHRDLYFDCLIDRDMTDYNWLSGAVYQIPDTLSSLIINDSSFR